MGIFHCTINVLGNINWKLYSPFSGMNLYKNTKEYLCKFSYVKK